MNTDTMSPDDILTHAVRIETESRQFYKDAMERVASEGTRALAAELMEAEITHARNLQNRLDRIAPDADHAMVDTSALEERMLVQVTAIPADADEQGILKIALERETATRDFYRTLLTITNLAQDLVELFEDLFEQESGHVKKVRGRMEALES